jgi:hypothetical protein
VDLINSSLWKNSPKLKEKYQLEDCSRWYSETRLSVMKVRIVKMDRPETTFRQNKTNPMQAHANNSRALTIAHQTKNHPVIAVGNLSAEFIQTSKGDAATFAAPSSP